MICRAAIFAFSALQRLTPGEQLAIGIFLESSGNGLRRPRPDAWQAKGNYGASITIGSENGPSSPFSFTDVTT